MPMRNRSTPANKRGFTIELGIGAIAAAIAISGCGIAQPPIAHTPNVVATPLQGQLAVSVAAAPTVGEVTPVYVSVANGTDDTRSVVPSQVFAVNDTGERIAPLPPGEAARQAGSAVNSPGAGAKPVRSAPCRRRGLFWSCCRVINRGHCWSRRGLRPGPSEPGALVGTAFGGFWGAFTGASRGQDKADLQANQQIDALSLKPEEVRRNYTVSGYVFFPKGQ